jgi:hypothetical protein
MLGLVALVAHIALAAPAPLAPAPYPFKVGETLQYTATLGYFPIGSASLSVARLAQERGAETFVLSMSGQGGPPGLGMSYEATSWVGTQEFTSRRFQRRVTQSGRVTEERFLIYPDSARYRQEGAAQAWVAPRDPLDELAFLYFLRSAPLQVGRSYTWARYFRNNLNPVVVQVTGRESVPMPGGQAAPCLVLHVTTRAGESDLWLTDDARRLPAQARVPFEWGNVTFHLAAVSTR